MLTLDRRIFDLGEISDPHGGTSIVAPLVADIVHPAPFDDLKRIGVDDSDAKHLMYAFRNDWMRFVTPGSDFFDRRDALEARCSSLRIVRPSKLVSELG